MPRRQQSPTTEAADRTPLSKLTLSACAKRKQAGIIPISLLTTDEQQIMYPLQIK
jgi:hypothetical protein